MVDDDNDDDDDDDNGGSSGGGCGCCVDSGSGSIEETNSRTKAMRSTRTSRITCVAQLGLAAGTVGGSGERDDDGDGDDGNDDDDNDCELQHNATLAQPTPQPAGLRQCKLPACLPGAVWATGPGEGGKI
ncbi:hypothetical protein PoB_004997600 [Plakobranchus ocellatus]|uniref:Uncharacterized protein n=1 Tax=Plakobranchus ocellatus TaxID=259542 RepID=A0AAV4BJE8_9GAST|nr:hypothetical protein PoB_004997600 [Plakobranchus ocellatus]